MPVKSNRLRGFQPAVTHTNISIYSRTADLLQDRSFIDVINKVKRNVQEKENHVTIFFLCERVQISKSNLISMLYGSRMF